MKERFMKDLKSFLTELSEEERNEILSFYEERFHTGKVFEGKSEQEIVSELESPEDIARNVLREYGKSPDSYLRKDEGDGVNVGSLIGVVCFDVFIASWLLPALFGIFIWFLSSLGSYVLSLFLMPFRADTAVISGLLVGFGVLFFGVLIALWLYDVLLSFVAWLLKWHMNALNLRLNEWPRKIRRLSAAHYLKKRPPMRKLKNQLKLAALLMVIIGGAYQIISLDGFTFNVGAEDNVSETFTREVADLSGWEVEGNLAYGDLTFHTHGSSEIRVETRVPENADMEVIINEDTRTVELSNERQLFLFNIGLWFTEDTYIDIYLPEDLTLERVDIEHMNGEIIIRDQVIDHVNLKTTNGSIRLSSIESPHPVRAATTNGNVTVYSSTASELMATSTNGKIEIRDGEYSNVDAKTTNGKILVLNINDIHVIDSEMSVQTTNGKIELHNVYVNEVSMKSTNGSLHYENEDNSFQVGRLNYSTTNGTMDILVPHVHD